VGESIAIVIVSQRTLLREGLVSLLQNSHFKVAASATSSSELKDVRIAPGRRVLSIVGIDDSDIGLTEAAENIKLLRLRFDGSKVVLVAEISGPSDMQQIVALTPNGYIANLCSRDILLRVIELALLDQQAFVFSKSASFVLTNDKDERERSPDARSVVSNPDPLHRPGWSDTENRRLSDREQQILGQLAKGNSNKEIARLFNITESTVKVHLKAILRKIAAHNRTQAAIWAVSRGYPSLPGSSEASSHQKPVLDTQPLSEPLSQENGKGTPLTPRDAGSANTH
jgi:two-component system nitrate/nitrite response regulator NarL